MPFKSQAQAAYFNANKAKLEAQGVDVDEYNAASKGKKLPRRAAKLRGYAFGGRPEVGVPAMVGEQGPEMFVPDQAGTIVPNQRTAEARIGPNIKGTYPGGFIPDLEVDDIHEWDPAIMQKYFPGMTMDQWGAIQRNKEGGFGIQFNKQPTPSLPLTSEAAPPTRLSSLRGYAEGGRPPVGQSSIVGEKGPELFIPDAAGVIAPNSVIQQMEAAARRSRGEFSRK